MNLQRSSKGSEGLLRALVPERKGVQLRPMFGNLAAFVHGNLFMGAYGDDLFVRLPEADRTELLKSEGASLFEPVPGRQMKDYVVVPRSWKGDKARIGRWSSKALRWASEMPEKKSKR